MLRVVFVRSDGRADRRHLDVVVFGVDVCIRPGRGGAAESHPDGPQDGCPWAAALRRRSSAEARKGVQFGYRCGYDEIQ